MYLGFKELLSVLNTHGVKYLIVGGYAVSFHAQPRATKDIDLVVKPDLRNAEALFGALAQFGAPLVGMTPAQFTDTATFFRIGNEPIAVDILSEIPGVDFDRAWERRVEAVIDTKSGLAASFISSDDLIAAKLAGGRPQDVADVAALREAKRRSR